MAKIIDATNPHTAWVTMGWRSLLNIIISGLLVGVVTFALYTVLERFVFEPIMCRDTIALARCDSKESFAGAMALVLASMLGLVLLVRERVYRPLLAILGIVVALWGVFALVVGLPWLVSLIVITLTFGVAYALFSWLVQPSSLTVSLVVVIIVAVLIRLILTV